MFYTFWDDLKSEYSKKKLNFIFHRIMLAVFSYKLNTNTRTSIIC
uniref:Uncharacterized protein n=1 Tax=viral metagenome TaxID=1070528 RepID=A0A6C0JDG4_9ZZZZ